MKVEFRALVESQSSSLIYFYSRVVSAQLSFYQWKRVFQSRDRWHTVRAENRTVWLCDAGFFVCDADSYSSWFTVFLQLIERYVVFTAHCYNNTCLCHSSVCYESYPNARCLHCVLLFGASMLHLVSPYTCFSSKVALPAVQTSWLLRRLLAYCSRSGSQLNALGFSSTASDPSIWRHLANRKGVTLNLNAPTAFGPSAPAIATREHRLLVSQTVVPVLT